LHRANYKHNFVQFFLETAVANRITNDKTGQEFRDQPTRKIIAPVDRRYVKLVTGRLIGSPMFDASFFGLNTKLKKIGINFKNYSHPSNDYVIK